MSGELICPDCGGVIGATEPSEAGQPCTCLPSEPSDVKSSTMVIDSPVSQKVCCVCGVDVTGKKRAKDDRGYWCFECHTKDKEKRRAERGIKSNPKPALRPGQLPEARKKSSLKSNCPECGRLVPVDSLEMWDGIQICSRCYRGHREAADRAVKKKTHDALHKKVERQRLLVLVAILIILGAILYLARKGMLPSPV